MEREEKERRRVEDDHLQVAILSFMARTRHTRVYIYTIVCVYVYMQMYKF